MPDFPIIDSHVHLYDVEPLSYGWMKGVPKLNRTHLVKDFDAARGAVQVDGIVFAEVAVDPGLHIEEARFVAEMAGKDPRLCATIAHAPLEKGKAVEADLATLAAIPMVKGIRRLIETEMNPAFCLEPAFIEAVKMLPRFGFSFDICVKHFAMTYAIELARRCPDTQFILDHIGKPDIKNGLKDPWWSQIRELAHEWLDQYIIESIEEAQHHVTQWLWTCNNERPNMGIGGITPAQKLKLRLAA